MIAPAAPLPAAAALDLELLHAFVVFAEHLNFTRAARALRVSQPALHMQVRKLSEALGVVLYRRRGRALELTADGRTVLGFGREMRERSAEFLAVLHKGAAPEPVVLCAGEGAYLYLLGPGVVRFTAAGAAPLRLLTRDRDGTVDAVLTGEAHLGVAALETTPDGLVAEVLAEVDQVLVVPASHPLAAKATLRLQDLDGARLVVPPAGRPHRVTIAQALRAAGVPWEVAVEASGWELLLHFVSLGLGLAVVNGCCRIPAGLVARPVRGLPRTTYYVLRRRGAPDDGARGLLRRTLLEHVASGAPTTRAARAVTSRRVGPPTR